MRRTTIGLALLAAMLNLYPSTAQTGVGGQRRVALVIGNSAYKYITPALPASANDANDMAAALMRLGFNEIRVLPNLTTDKMSAAVTDFATNVVRKGDLAFFYYSGHGAQVNQENFLLGVDYELQSSDDFVARRAYRMTTVRDALEASGAAVRILVFDACRNSPVLKAGSKRIAPGLAALEGGGEGTLIAFASADNQAALASDKDRNSVFTRELLAALTANTGDVETLFKEVRRNVSAATNGRQTPYLYRFFSSPVYLRGAPATAAVPPDAEAEAWRLTKDSRNRADLEAFLAAFPSGPHRTEARLTLEAVVEAESRSSGKTMLNPVTRAIYVWLPPARFMAGCAPRETDCGDGAAPWHEVEVGKGFWIQKTPVTLSEYRAYAKATKTKIPPGYQSRVMAILDTDTKEMVTAAQEARAPVLRTVHEQAENFCAWAGGRLPTEIEWEYAARAQTIEGTGITFEMTSTPFDLDHVVKGQGNARRTKIPDDKPFSDVGFRCVTAEK